MKEALVFYEDYRRYLNEVFELRIAKNPNYSLRAFARDLGIGASTLSEVLQGKYGLSTRKSRDVSSRLRLSDVHQQHFCDLITVQHSHNQSERERARIAIEKRLTQKMQELSRDQFDTISEWQHLALLELMETASFKSDTAWIAARLGLDEDVITESIERLERLDMVIRDENNNWKPTGSFTSVESKLASIAIRYYHKQLIAKGVDAIEEQAIDERDISSTVFALSPEDIPVAKQLLREFSQKLALQLSKNNTKDEVYCLSMQMFSLTKKVQS
ncbi:DUF4423 domain-containing protein [Bdellovibrio sp. HCB2-146]|uniref:DUF4423 domain-containing protein n=1 Tax=Bdellovibrio sp. HCB2-146 TaxID=3394362 RepID=UPI0039BC278C